MAASSDLLRPLRRAEYDQLIRLGAFADEHIELLEGALVPMSPIGPPHAATVQRLSELLLPALLGRARVRIQNPIAASDVSEPEPDVAVVPLGEYDADHPAQAHLIIEVADSSLAHDRGRKARIYAACQVPEYWIVNLVDRTIEVRTEPVLGSYQRVTIHPKGATLCPRDFPELVLRVDDVIKP